ncbi:GntR family transcriptional regulator [Radiobacillus kanasensis]|uniref:GntR family transcriptional regulator n=1 Tax=Radiobacillus kanasensis TaxID=2844358 RepID=UPI001E516F8A|nr:GntR family transcriptional regulator [Radiobacillus kanasensis]UFT98565.1 GntR family transcriptional regulator [Radiobacillus kanasensis]
MLNKNSPLPIYYQLEEEIRQLIQSEQLKPGELLPSEREYAELHGISRMTVRQAINNLASEGLLYRQKGKGTFVAERKFEQNLQGLTSFSEDMKARGLTPSSKLITFEEIVAPPDIAHKLHISDGDKVYLIQRIRLANNEPVAVEAIYTPKSIVGSLTKEDYAGSFYEFMEKKKGLQIGHADQELESALANTFEMEHLQIKDGDPILLMKRITHLSNDKPFEYVKSAYRADRYKFKLHLPR